MKKLVVVALVFSMLVGSIGVVKSVELNEDGKLIGFGTYSTTSHEPEPSKS